MKEQAEMEKNSVSIESKRKKYAHLRNASDVLAWMLENNANRTPRKNSSDKTESELGSKLANLRCKLVKPYMELETEEQREEFRTKYPYVDEVMEIMEEINELCVPTQLRNLRAVLKWQQDNNTLKKPNKNSSDELEGRLGRAINSANKHLISPFLELKTEKEREDFRKKHPEIDEVLDLMRQIDVPTALRNVMNAERFTEENRGRVPSVTSKDKKEKSIAFGVINVRRNFIKPYFELETEEERQRYIKLHPEFNEVLGMMLELDKGSRNSNHQKLVRLIEEYFKKQFKLNEAKQLEAKYKAMLNKQRNS